MGRHSSEDRHRSRRYDDEAEDRARKSRKSRRSDSSDDSELEERRRKRKSEKRRKRRDETSGSEIESDGEDRRKRHRKSRRDESDASSSDDEGRKFTEEELNEYLVKKAQRKAARVAKKLKTQTVSGYSNDSNPFGDSNLTEKFVWRKKIERDVANKKMDLKDLSVKAEKLRQKERMREIEKVKKRREERAIEKAQHEEEMAMLARERARAEFQDWEKKEEEFHFDQSKVRAEIRLKEGRAKPIDVLSRNLNSPDEFDIAITEPYKIFKGLTVREMEDLRDDIRMHLELDRTTQTHIDFWEAMMVVCDWELAESLKKDGVDKARVRGEEPGQELMADDFGLHKSVDPDVKTLLHNMSYRQLEEEQVKIEEQMRSGSAKIVEFWESLLKRLQIFKAKARLREIYSDVLQQHLQRIDESEINKISNEDEEEAMVTEELNRSPTPEVEPEVYDDDDPGSFSPQLVHDYEADEIVDPETDRAELERKRAEVLEEQQKRLHDASGPSEEENIEHERAIALKAMGNMEEGDAILGSGAEVNLESQVYWWHDKYRPRKPKYFNRVHTGYEWNKYNQTHYDHDNPPPKIVQGYKFNIFYPDLVDKTKAPTYAIERDGSSGETCLIRFHAGPPYEDIAFRIVNKEWEYSHKKGFKCTFERGILHVYFNFKRYRYRR
ncbi:hypothetical protein SELMODRAFT_177683 [Selaginella moellendorffii]|uniref:Splicing factor Cactin n=1 Tax=Selaginella moellendorffii TaxID=88036 RepID=D8S7X0_SELML|nr:cactin [Selaginella moellendorffii]EFJ19424.1 hypothetical protein SELMODRAFT_177683 [Selaginella moellendorffii]|eukprot:XP_002979535.1 cactin [Selaginella moellendorffii]